MTTSTMTHTIISTLIISALHQQQDNSNNINDEINNKSNISDNRKVVKIRKTLIIAEIIIITNN